MTNITTKICLLLLLATSLVLNAKTIRLNSNDTLSILEVKGKIIKREKTSGICKVQLIYNNIVKETKFITDGKSFLFTVPNNQQYIIKVIMEGYTEKTVYVNTGQLKGEHQQGPYRYEFVVDMEVQDERNNSSSVSGINAEEMRNLKSTPEFNWNRKYCKKITPLP